MGSPLARDLCPPAIWVWVKIKPPGYGRQVLGLGSIYEGYSILLAHSQLVFSLLKFMALAWLREDRTPSRLSPASEEADGQKRPMQTNEHG